MANYTQAERDQMAKTGLAMPDGSFPIKHPGDVHDAITTLGMYKGDKTAAKAHIIKRAKALGCTNMLPDSWNVTAHAEPAGPPTVTIPDVEICRVGNWASQLSGRVPITADDIAAMADAGQDPEVDHAPVKIGHVDPRFDGEPAFGWLTNIRTQGDRVIADIADVPRQMAHLVQTAFKRRSAEIAWGVKTPSGKTYRAALAGLALLGVTPPAVKGLADVVARYSGPQCEADQRGTVTVIDGDDGDLAVLHARAINAQAEFEARRQFLSGHSGDFHEPAAQSHLNAPAPTEGLMTDDEVRAKLGLPAEVPVTDQIRAVADAQAKAEADAAAQAQADQEAAARAEAERRAAEETARNGAQPPTVTVDRGAFEALQQQASQGAEAHRILETQERDRELAAALSGGKIAPASVAQWEAAWARDKEGTKALLSTLPQAYSTVTNFSGLPATSGPDNGGISDDAWAAFEADLHKNGLR